LKLFTEFEVHATWAVVGFLFFKNTRALLDAAPATLPVYENPALAAYQDLPGPGACDSPDSIFFAPSLIEHIARTPHQEIGTHTFSHFSCLEPGQNLASFREDLKAACNVAAAVYYPPTSLVFPKNQVNQNYLSACAELGIKAYRGNPPSWLYRAVADCRQTPIRRLCRLFDTYFPLSGSNCTPLLDSTASQPLPVNIPASRYLRPYSSILKFAEPIRLWRIKRDLDTAAKHNLVFHLWWHPHDFGRNLDKNLGFLRKILCHFSLLQRRYGMRTLTMQELAECTTP
jgi:peptidoglycan/xylan/chitin deacetylase (PgdA/CDA1 family)